MTSDSCRWPCEEIKWLIVKYNRNVLRFNAMNTSKNVEKMYIFGITCWLTLEFDLAIFQEITTNVRSIRKKYSRFVLCTFQSLWRLLDHFYLFFRSQRKLASWSRWLGGGGWVENSILFLDIHQKTRWITNDFKATFSCCMTFLNFSY